MTAIHIAVLLFYIFDFIWAGILTIRVMEHSFSGGWFIFYLMYWFFFFFTGIPLLIVALPLRLLGIRLYPAFVPDSMK